MGGVNIYLLHMCMGVISHVRKKKKKIFCSQKETIKKFEQNICMKKVF